MTVDERSPLYRKFALKAHRDKNNGTHCIHLVDVFKKLIVLLKQARCCSVEYGEDVNTDTVSPCGVAVEEVPLAIADGACAVGVSCGQCSQQR